MTNKELQMIQFNGILMVRNWLEQAFIKRDQDLVVVYSNILKHAIEDYNTQFGKSLDVKQS